VHNSLAGTGEPADMNALFHHAFHARAVMEQAKATGIPVETVIEALGVDESQGEDEDDFLLAHLQ
jgi:hypothetical protein